MTDRETENRTNNVNNGEENTEKKPAEVFIERGGLTEPEMNELQMKAAAFAYAKYLRDHGLKPGDVTLADVEDLKPAAEMSKEKVEDTADSEDKRNHTKPQKKAKEKKKIEKQAVKQADKQSKSGKKKEKNRRSPFAAITEVHDSIQDVIFDLCSRAGKNFMKWLHTTTQAYRNSRRSIGIAILFIGVLASALLIIFDYFTVYEYAYNGKVLGYVKDQEEVTDVLDIAGIKLTQNNSTEEAGVEFVANQNVTFNQVDGRGKSTDDADIAVNKLIFLTDVETEAYGIYDGDRVVAIVKSSEEGERLLDQALTDLSRPDPGMELISAEFINELAIKPINVLLSSVQSYEKARKQMVNGGTMETYHIVEEDETIESLAGMFGVEAVNIYDERNEEVASEIEQGDRVCIRSTVEPVVVRMVETGRLKEVIEFETIKKETDEYYKGDTFVEQEGENGSQIFEGTITKIAGEVTDRKEDKIEVLKKKKDKIILVGTAERPKTAPTGTFAMPIQGAVVTSEFGPRWGRLHAGMDFGAATGTPIYASDGGTVTRASYYGGYGYCIDLDNGPGRATRYGHCSKLLVSAGDQVYQGQLIGLVGNTGNSFGSHLHFEIHINGSATNPRPYLGM